MSFLSNILKKSNSDDEVKLKPKFYDIICPYCFEKFSPNDVVFRAAHSVEEDEDFKLRPDEKLNRYRKNTNEEEAMSIERVLNPQHDYELIKKMNVVDGIILEITDKYDVKSKKRLCPYCHNDLPNTAGKGPSEVISVVGASQVGKSVYMTALLHTIQNYTAGNFDAACMPINTKYNDELKKYQKTLYENGELLPSTQKEERIEPLILHLKFKGENPKPPVTLMFFDVAGEGMMDPEYIERHGKHIKNSTGIIFLVDPVQIRTVRKKISIKKNQGDFSDFYAEPLEIITKLFENFITDEENQETNIPTAVVITKSDMLDTLIEDDYISENSNIFNQYEHKGYFNLTEYGNLNGEVKKFITEVDAAFKDNMEAYFKNTAYFAVSALGSNPVEQKIQGILNPIRVDEPFLWLLYKRGYIEGK